MARAPRARTAGAARAHLPPVSPGHGSRPRSPAMSHPLDLSIGQRLALGFGLLLFMLATFVGVVSNWNARSTAAQDRLVSELVPLNEQASVLERELFQTSVAARDYLVSPEGATAAQYRAEARDAGAAPPPVGELP